MARRHAGESAGRGAVSRSCPEGVAAGVAAGVGSETGWQETESCARQVYGRDVIAVLEVCSVGRVASGLAPFLPEIVDRLRAVSELRITQQTRDVLVGMSAATIDRRLAGARQRLVLEGRSGTKPGSLRPSRATTHEATTHLPGALI